MKEMIIKAGREKSLLRRHPWIFSGAIERLSGAVESGETVKVLARDGRFLALAAHSPESQIAGRVWSFSEGEHIDAEFFERRIATAVAARAAVAGTDAMRLVHGDSDGLPGLVVDRYGAMLVVQSVTAGTERWLPIIVEALARVTGIGDMYERSDADVRELEGLAPRVGVLRGSVAEGPLEIHENGLRFEVDVRGGHKTGFYLDQRENRALVRSLAAGREVLNCFCYTGTMSVAAIAGGAAGVLSIDSSGPALALGARNLALNVAGAMHGSALRSANESANASPHESANENRNENTDAVAARAEWMEADVFAALRQLRDRARSFDFIILDPPKFAPTAHSVEKAARAYKDINLLAFKLLRPGGLLATFSCSGGVSADLFQKIVAGAALDANADAQILRRLGPGIDHPVALNFPEGEYLKGLLIAKRGA